MSHPGSGGKAPLPNFLSTTLAKKINKAETPENPDVAATQTVAEQEAERIQEETVQSETEATAKPKTQQTKEQETTDPHILELLKKFPGYPALYIGNGGSTFSPDTAIHIRGNAVLYKNPYFKQSKMKS